MRKRLAKWTVRRAIILLVWAQKAFDKELAEMRAADDLKLAVRILEKALKRPMLIGQRRTIESAISSWE